MIRRPTFYALIFLRQRDEITLLNFLTHQIKNKFSKHLKFPPNEFKFYNSKLDTIIRQELPDLKNLNFHS